MESNGVSNGINQLATTHIIYHDDPISHGTARYLKLHPRFPNLFLPPNSIICSSSKGIVLFHDASTNNYCLFNPATAENSIKPLPPPPRPHHPNTCTAILAMTESSFDVVFLMVLNDESVYSYEVDVFSSDTESWYNLEVAGLRSSSFIDAHSYVSCNRNMFFLVVDDAMVRISVLKLNIVRRRFTFISMPYYNTNLESSTQLGRVGETICLVIADTMKIEIYLLQNHQRRREGNEGINRLWLNLYSVNVDLEQDCDVNIDGRRIRCKGMPRPLRFESFKVELPLWVDGKIVMVDGIDPFPASVHGPLLYHLRIVDHASVLPAYVVLGLPHVMSATRLPGQIVSP